MSRRSKRSSRPVDSHGESPKTIRVGNNPKLRQKLAPLYAEFSRLAAEIGPFCLADLETAARARGVDIRSVSLDEARDILRNLYRERELLVRLDQRARESVGPAIGQWSAAMNKRKCAKLFGLPGRGLIAKLDAMRIKYDLVNRQSIRIAAADLPTPVAKK